MLTSDFGQFIATIRKLKRGACPLTGWTPQGFHLGHLEVKSTFFCYPFWPKPRHKVMAARKREVRDRRTDLTNRSLSLDLDFKEYFLR